MHGDGLSVCWLAYNVPCNSSKVVCQAARVGTLTLWACEANLCHLHVIQWSWSHDL